MLRFYAPVCELEAMYKFSTDIFSLAEHSDWALQSFTLCQAKCAIFSVHLNGCAAHLYLTYVSSSVKARDSPSLSFFLTHSHTHREREREREGERERERGREGERREGERERVLHVARQFCMVCKQYSLLYFPVKIMEFLWNSSAFKNCRVLQ